ncbi:PP0621 family protein [Methyloversatilis thermotolerans]|uniref:PP0621 family protein n=1 Tax=Methyloversatilis thermotolerans TaxID=1346290 RepID=UPI0003690C1B|nr:PP0621 family protein [Methyloversatilis thermotolerans]
MSRILFFLLLVLLVWIWFFKRPSMRRDKPAPPREPEPERMVTCAHCRLRLPEGEAIAAEDGLFFCCPEHRDEHAAHG